MKTEILGVQFDTVKMKAAEDAACRLISEKRGGYIVTVNAEILLMAQKDAAYRKILNDADLVCCDGVGVICAGRILGTPLPERVAGSDLVPLLLGRLAASGGKVFLYGAKPGVAEAAKQNLHKQYPGLGAVGTENGYIRDMTGLWKKLDEAQPDLILAGLGVPKQEYWMAESRGRTDAVMIGIGGLLDVFAGNVSRAPMAWRRLGLEWLYRMIREPRRIGRVIRLPKILCLALAERLRKRRTPAS